MVQYDYKIRVRYADVDQMGYVYYGHYARYYEIGRAELLRSIGYPYARLEQEGIMCPVASMHIRYLRAASYDEHITIRTFVRNPPGRQVTFHTEIYLENGKLANAGEIRLAFVNAETRESCLPPEKLMNTIRGYFEV